MPTVSYLRGSRLGAFDQGIKFGEDLGFRLLSLLVLLPRGIIPGAGGEGEF